MLLPLEKKIDHEGIMYQPNQVSFSSSTDNNSSGARFQPDMPEQSSDGVWDQSLDDIHPHTANSQSLTPVWVVAEYDFQPSVVGELGFVRGDHIKVLDSGYKGWWLGELRGRTGIFPVNYVVSGLVTSSLSPRTLNYINKIKRTVTAEVNDMDENTGTVLSDFCQDGDLGADNTTWVIAIYTFEVTEQGELGFEKGDIIKILDRTFKDWWKGLLRGEIGIIPVNYVVGGLNSSRFTSQTLNCHI